MKLLVLQHTLVQHAGFLGKLIAEKGIAHTLVDLSANHSLTDLSDFAGVIVLGGPMNAYEEQAYPFLLYEDRLIKDALERKLPILGIGLGGQLLAKALGARVYRNQVREIGFYPISLTEAGARDRLFQGCGRMFSAFEWHGDTFDIPEGAMHLARSYTCEHQAFRYGENAYAVLFHLQVSPAMVALWAEEYREELKMLHLDSRVASMVLEAYRLENRLQAQTRRIFENFLAMAKEAERQ